MVPRLPSHTSGHSDKQWDQEKLQGRKRGTIVRGPKGGVQRPPERFYPSSIRSELESREGTAAKCSGLKGPAILKNNNKQTNKQKTEW